MRPGLLSDLAAVGCEIFLEGDHVKLRFRKSGNTPDTVAVNQEKIEEEARYDAKWVSSRPVSTALCQAMSCWADSR
jgi:hypothetical protein